MDDDSLSQRTAQLDKAEREHLEDVVTEMRERIEDNVEYQLRQQGLDKKPDESNSLDEDTQQLVEAVELEAVDGHSWEEAFEEYVTGVGYTIVNRLAALRCMEVREFIAEEVTVFKDNGLTPAAETLVHEEFLMEDEAILEAYHNACDDLAEEIEILFDRSTAYSLVDPDDDTFEELCGKLDGVPDEVWRADDVLGWVYEYYNVKLLEALRNKARTTEYAPEDVPPANQFYTPHWVVRMLTDNSLGKLYLEQTGELQDGVEVQQGFTSDERKNRPLSLSESPDIADFCTYLVPSEKEGKSTNFDHPSELRVIDPACGSGHFLLYAFDVLERIWRAETDLPHEDIPRRILQHNLYGVDLDMRACQLAAFNLYLKGRTHAEADGADSFEMPEVGIVCADSSVAEVNGVEAVFDEVAGDAPKVEKALRRILDVFEEVHGLGSLLDVRGTLGDLFEDNSDIEGMQLTLGDDPRESYTLGQLLHSLRVAVEEHRDSDSFLAQDLRSFVRLLDILAQDYDVALMNPPYGSRNRMPSTVQKYIEERYRYPAEFYINFFEVGERMVKNNGRVGMLVPRTFMFRHKFEQFRKDFIGDQSGGFDFLAEFGVGILDNATVRTAGTVVRLGDSENKQGEFIRLHDIEKGEKEAEFINVLKGAEHDIKRSFTVDHSEFEKVPGSTICYSTPKEIRDLHSSGLKLDAERAGLPGESVGQSKQGVATADSDRFLRYHWEIEDFEIFNPISKGGSDAWITPVIKKVIEWGERGTKIKRYSNTVRTPNEELYGQEGLTWTFLKETGRRFGYYPSGGIFSHTAFIYIPNESQNLWNILAAVNSDLYHALFLSITIERNWNAGEVGSIPWHQVIGDNSKLEKIAKSQYRVKITEQLQDPVSPFYIAPALVPENSRSGFFFKHPQIEYVQNRIDIRYGAEKKDVAILERVRKANMDSLVRRQTLESYSEEIDEAIFDELTIDQEIRGDIRQEIFLRTSESPVDREIPDPESVPEIPENIDTRVKDLLHHFAMEVIREESDGIIPLHDTDDWTDMLNRIVERFHDVYGEHAADRLVEVDEILGAKSAAEEAYPNLRAFIEEDLFDYHVSTMENTPIVWKLTTERLIPDSTGEGFACFLDYHGLDSGLFDRLTNQYLEPRKAELRERRSAANRRRGDDSLSASEQAEAAERYERCTSGLDQISVFEEVLQDLGSTDEREFDAEDCQRVEDLVPKIAAFREETHKRIDTLAELRERKGEKWFQDTFSDKFWETIDEWRDEWLDALDELELACEAYARPSDEPVEAHLADLFDYFNWRLKGSDHYSSSGILFMTYYFEREGADLLDEDGQPYDHLSEDERMLASLATGLDDRSLVNEEYLKVIADDESTEDLPPLAEFKALAEEIDDRCQTVDKRIPSNWTDRALSEITTAGYQPNHKHGVEINITPLVEAEIVPTTVDDQVI